MIRLSAALSRVALIGEAIVFAVGISCRGTPHASGRTLPTMRASGGPWRSDADRVTNAAIRSVACVCWLRSLPSNAAAPRSPAFAGDDAKCLIQLQEPVLTYLVQTRRRPPPNGR